MALLLRAALLGAVLGSACAAVHFREEFTDGVNWQRRWLNSQYKPDLGKFKLTAGKFYGDPVRDKGLQTCENSKFYAISSRFKPFNNKGKTLVIQYTVKHEQKIDCGGGYIKLFSSNLDQKNMSSESQYYIMFGPDICGSETKKVHVILNYKNKLYPIKKQIRCKNWDEPEYIPDTSAERSKDWNNATDGEWRHPMIKNPLYRGEWKPRKIDNPNYKGVWPHPQIDNPNYLPDFNILSYENIGVIGLDIWQVRAGTIFDNFLITDDEEYAEDFGYETWGETKDPEKVMNIKQTEEEKKRERAEEEKHFRERLNKKVEKKKESGKKKLRRNTVQKEEL
ncbi:PREDICTED: calreticulin-3 isoform X4 [Gavialis gangeticus]|uniref:calreticulin-3 isoform X4 n=1 Tax=Gavialis gangeticus TaxID=94835 RepID=UPI00092FB9C2|nr:PREDICTED: calreticulin-3 isoform X4 [Gavialis gangeticus]